MHMDVSEKDFLRPIRGVSVRDRMRNEDIRTGCCLKCMLSEKMDQSVMGWYEHMDRKSENRAVKRFSRAGVDEAWGKRSTAY